MLVAPLVFMSFHLHPLLPVFFYYFFFNKQDQVCGNIPAVSLPYGFASTVMEGRLQYLSQGWTSGLSKPEVQKLSGEGRDRIFPPAPSPYSLKKDAGWCENTQGCAQH